MNQLRSFSLASTSAIRVVVDAPAIPGLMFSNGFRAPQ
jgi:hypothetical protein